jgi:DNA-binding MurR/RpiR family transcriptional regulator
MARTAARTFEALSDEIARRHGDLSGRLQQIAEFAVRHPNDMALGTVSALAKEIGVQPSAMVRFANSLGYAGFSDMQQVFRARLVDAASPSYRERIASLRRNGGNGMAGAPADILAQFVADDVAALEALYHGIPEARLERAIELLAAADTIYVLAQGRSFPVAYYIDYALYRLDLKSHLLDGVGGMTRERSHVIGKRDALIVVSFRDYASETVLVASDTAARGVPVIVITDAPLGPFAGIASVTFDIGEAKSRPFRSLVAPICLAQSLVVALGHRLADRNGDAQ